MNALILRGSFVGMASAIIGSVLFAFADVSVGIIRNGMLSDFGTYFSVIIVLVVAGLIFSIIPGSLGGVLLAFLLGRSDVTGTISKRKVILKGALLGLLIGAGICMYIYFHEYVYMPNPPMSRAQVPMDFDIFLWRSFYAISIASLVGGWASKSLEEYILQNGTI